MPAYTAHTARIIHGEEEKDAIIILWENYPKKKEGKGKALGGKNRKEEKTKTFFPFFLLPLLPFFSRRNSLSTFHQRKNGGMEEEGGREGGDADMKNTKSGKGRGGQISKTESPPSLSPSDVARLLPQATQKAFLG